MTAVLMTIEVDTEIKWWLEWFSHNNNLPLSRGFNHVLSLGRQAAENDSPPVELPIAQKLLIQCAMESLLILKEAHLLDAEQRNAISERAKAAIRKTLGLQEKYECPSS